MLKSPPEPIEAALILPLGENVSIPFQSIPAGEFRMGTRGARWNAEEPVHVVQITAPFYLGTYPVTQEQFAEWKPEHENHFPDRPSDPAERVTWDEAKGFCDWLNLHHAKTIPAGSVAGLPTEAQWEYACRAGTETEYHSGDGETALNEVGWYDGNAKGSTQPVGKLDPNGFGLFDMHGNVWEWCRDLWDEHAYKHRVDGVCDPEVTESSSATA